MPGNVNFSDINCYQPNISATQRLRVICSTQVFPNPFLQYLPDVCFLYAKNYLLDITYKPLSLDYTLSNNSGQIRGVIDTPLNIREFQKNFDEKIKNRSVVLELTDEFGQTEIVNNYQAVNFLKTATADRNQPKTYELIFVPAKIKTQSAKVQFQKIIQSIDCFPSAQSPIGTVNSDIIINLFSFCDPTIFSFGYSLSPNVSEVFYNNFTPKNLIRSIQNGTYYFFAVNTLCPKYFDSFKAIILNGNITFEDAPAGTTPDNNPYISDAITPDSEIFGELSQQ